VVSTNSLREPTVCQLHFRMSFRCRWALSLLLGVSIALLVGCPPSDVCLQCGAFAVVGSFSDPGIQECSGLVASQIHSGILWVHNDSGDAARVFAVKEDGTLRGEYALQGVSATDWEDIAWGPCSSGGWSDCLYIGDIGDNAKLRSEVQIYRVREPTVPLEGPVVYESLNGVEQFNCAYPDGPHDAETLLVDPDSGIPYIITKDAAGNTGVYRSPQPLTPGETTTLEKLTVLTSGSYLTAGDVSPNGSRIILRDYLTSFEYPRLSGQSFAQIFDNAPCTILPALEIQGEALAIGPSSLEVYTTSEGQGAPIHRALCSAP